MSDPSLSSPPEVVPGTPGIKEIRFDPGPEGFDFGAGSGHCNPSPSPSPRPGIRRVSLRAEIDTTPPFGSVKEAVTRFGGHGPWINPLYKFGDHNNYNGEEEFDIKKVEEQTAELEKDLIVKELETLDVLEELTTTKRIVEELKRQLQKEALKCLNNSSSEKSPIIKETNTNSDSNVPTSSPDSILTELKRARLNLGKTITDLGAIQSSVESLTNKMRKEKEFIEKSRHKLTDEDDDENAAECLKRTAEMRWVAAKKMGEAARAAEAVALAEITALADSADPAPIDKMSFDFLVRSPPPGWAKKRLALADAMMRIDEAHASKMAIMRKLREAGEEVRLGRKALEEAMDRVDVANRKQLAVEDALSRWAVHPPEMMIDRRSPRIVHADSAFRQNDHRHVDYRGKIGADGIKPVLKTTVSMRDVLSKKQAASETTTHQHHHKVALSDMLQALRDDLNFPAKAENKERDRVAVSDASRNRDRHRGGVDNPQKQFLTQRKKFGFIQISLPLTKPRKKKLSQESL